MYIVIFIAAANKQEAKKISQELIRQKLAACVNMVGPVDSLFFWKSKVDQAKEVLLIVKTKKEKMAKIIKTVRSMHSYEVPEVIALPVIAGDSPYLRWIDESLR